ncbi:MAG: TetR/AcrR family transcriptional regulator [Pseudonocardia sp.]|nr:TetR/AcrR family transcriptional regulator [Pseudonocardia sp.]
MTSAARSLRRAPKQARAQQRVNRILDAAEELFAEVGYDAASTNQIATRANASIGSLYEFFPNKQALAQALADRYVEQLGALIDQQMVNDPVRTGEQLVDTIVTSLDVFWRRHPAVVSLLRGSLGAPALIGAGERLRMALVGHIETMLIERRPDTYDRERFRLVAEIAIDLTRTLLERVQAEPLHRRALVLRELKLAVLGYLRYAVPPAPGPAVQRRTSS